MRKKEKGKFNILKKILGFVPGILYNILVIFCVLLIAIIVMQRLTDSNRSIKGYKIFKVVSGSMVPKYDVGEVVICKEIPVEDIKVGNAIVYRGKIGDLNGRLVMHEVIAINQDENNELKFYARGLNNSKGDPEISENQILGVVKFKSGILTLLYKLATSIYASFIIVTILVINVFISFKSGKVKEEPNKDLKEDDKKYKEEVKLNDTKTNEDLQKEICELKNQIEELKSKENANQEEKDVRNNEKITNKDKKVGNKEEVVIDSKKQSDKIEDVEKAKSTTKKQQKNNIDSFKRKNR